MSNAAIGKVGKILLTGATVVEIRNWSIDRDVDQIDTSSMSSGGNREFKPGMAKWSGSFETIAYVDLVTIQNVIGSFFVGSAASTLTPCYAGTVNISKAPVEVPYDKEVAYKHAFVGSGPCTVTTS